MTGLPPDEEVCVVPAAGPECTVVWWVVFVFVVPDIFAGRCWFEVGLRKGVETELWFEIVTLDVSV